MVPLAAVQHRVVQDLILNHKEKLFELVDACGPVIHILFPEIFEENLRAYQSVFDEYEIPGEIFYAQKANKGKAFLEIAARNDIGAEVSSLYELREALGHGIVGDSIISSGPYKNQEFLLLSLRHSATLSIDSIEELLQSIEISGMLSSSKAKILLRVNDLSSRISRFGIPLRRLPPAYEILERYRGLAEFRGFSFHLDGYSIKERSLAVIRIMEELRKVRQYGFECDVIDVGGGFTVQYVDEDSWRDFVSKKDVQEFYRDRRFTDFYPYFSDFPKERFLERILQYNVCGTGMTIADKLREEGLRLFIEPGRSLLDQAGITIMRVKGVKQNVRGDNIIVVDGNINYLSEQWFNTEFLPEPVLIPGGVDDVNEFVASVGGNTCMETDMLTWRKIAFSAKPQAGDLLVYINTAGYQMDSNESTFNLLPTPRKIALYACHTGEFLWKTDESFSQLDIIEV